MIGEVIVYLREDKQLYAASFSRNLEGWVIVNGWFRQMRPDVSEKDLGVVALEGLRLSDKTVDNPAVGDINQMQPLLRMAKVRSFSAFTIGTRAVSIAREDFGGFFLIPTRNPNQRRNNTFHYMPELEFGISAEASVKEIGGALREGLRRCISD